MTTLHSPSATNQRELGQSEVPEQPERVAGSDRGGTGSGLPSEGGVPERSNGWAVLRLLAAVAAVVALFVLFRGVALLIVLLAIIVMVMVHELGHFLTAKWSGMKVTEYFVGFGPRLWWVRRGETDYGIKPILAGGYVKIIGMSSLEEVDAADESRAYRQQPFYRRIIVASAGSFMHFVMAFLLAWSAVLIFGVPSSRGVAIGAFEQWAGHSQTAAQAAGLRVGDVIVSVDGRTVTSTTQLTNAINRSPGKPLALSVERGGATLHLTVVPAAGHVSSAGVETFGSGPGPAKGLIGISSAAPRTPEGPVRAIGTSVNEIGHITSATVAGIGHLFSPSGIGSLFNQVTSAHAASVASQNGTRPESIVGAVRTATQAEQSGILNLIEVLIALNIVIGLLNMLPMLPLDGGHVAIAIYERVRTRRGQPYYRADAAKLLPVVYAFVSVLLLIVGAAVFLDIAHPAANPFH